MLIKSLFKKYLKDAFINTSLQFKEVENNLYFMYGHYAYKEKKEDSFKELMDNLSLYVDFINFENAIEMLQTSKTFNLEKPTVCFSFDDGFEECYTHIYPILNKYNVNACFFINPNFVDGDDIYIRYFQKEKVNVVKNPMTRDMIIEMDNNGMIFGCHTLNHSNLRTISHSEIEYELENSKKWIENLLQKPCEYFAWPYGTMNHINNYAIEYALTQYKYIFSAIRNEKYFCCGNKRIINRDHFEGFWKNSYIKYFLTLTKKRNFHND